MAYQFRPEHSAFFQSLKKYEVEYVLIGGVAVNLHGYIRGTGDVDILFGPSLKNKQKLIDAIEEYGFDTENLRAAKPDEITMFALGERTYQGHIELTNRIAGITFDEISQQMQHIKVDGVTVNYLHYEDLIKSKLATGRRKDLIDVEKLRQIKRAETIKEDDTSASSDSQLTLWEKIKSIMFPKNDG